MIIIGTLINSVGRKIIIRPVYRGVKCEFCLTILRQTTDESWEKHRNELVKVEVTPLMRFKNIALLSEEERASTHKISFNINEEYAFIMNREFEQAGLKHEESKIDKMIKVISNDQAAANFIEFIKPGSKNLHLFGV